MAYIKWDSNNKHFILRSVIKEMPSPEEIADLKTRGMFDIKYNVYKQDDVSLSDVIELSMSFSEDLLDDAEKKQYQKYKDLEKAKEAWMEQLTDIVTVGHVKLDKVIEL